ncbi:unnamed protein product [Hydatigera taeniaeformis]|uniref:Uncharacterized protein n=1 Tax=Hydatigena taeniaeformis TaxID=6205 RepID=A0A0R3XB60_HYDTA|nr:unnamed protein product [Hydatigera taeniaeformis]
MPREPSSPTELANPQPQQIVRLLLQVARRDLPFIEQMQTSCFRVPRLFLLDCRRNLLAHERDNDPPLQCSLRYCIPLGSENPPIASLQQPLKASALSSGATTPTSQLKGSYQRKLFGSVGSPAPSTPPPTDETKPPTPHTTPAILKPLRTMSFKFRVRRSPFKRRPLKAIQLPTLSPVKDGND